jgi:hypothetical protein
MNFGLPSAGRGRLAQHGRPGQGATHLRTAINTPGIAPPCGDRNEFRSTLRWTRASRATRQTWTGGNASENRDKHSRNRPPAATEMNFGLPSAGRGRLARHGRPGQGATHLRTAINTPGIAPPCGDRNECRSTLRWTRASRATRQTRTGGNASENRDKHSRNRPPAATEMNFGLPSAGRGRLVQHGRPGQGATHLRTAINTPGIAPPCGDRNECRSTLRWTRASRATRQTRTGGNASENRDKHAWNRPSLR